jgi:hypothetical protein
MKTQLALSVQDALILFVPAVDRHTLSRLPTLLTTWINELKRHVRSASSYARAHRKPDLMFDCLLTGFPKGSRRIVIA